ncbi:hypothetical protein [Phytohabitans aurantiacus]|uniref:Uncharacterized protein n=1 Tax=Phytohabitans aurantiacus TaxID=3016789 RepID=A0ABQ5R516_9ACTN|nr:hypothetical protein [Phytohabitans aurantiacus]GLI00666.1 hypothetical protein Pa4123_59420 [Phytohabitans aurantiacus]
MTEFYICPPCGQPVVDQPQHLWTVAARFGNGWRHLIDDSPLCPAPSGGLTQPVAAHSPTPHDSQTREWAAETHRLFSPDGPFLPERLATAAAVMEHLTGWLLTATGPAAAPRTLTTYRDAAALLGSLHRVARLLARTCTETSDHIGGQLATDASARPTPGQDQADFNKHRSAMAFHLPEAASRFADAAAMTGRAWIAARATSALDPSGNL